jgi:hypothetical protein
MTELEFYETKYGAAVEHFYKETNTDVKSLEENHKYHYDSLNNVKSIFEKQGIVPATILKQSISTSDFKQGWDVIVPVGGDGTFIDTARYVLDDTLFFGIKSSPNSVGGHFNTNFSNAEENITKLLKGDFSIEKRTRIKGVINNGTKIIDYALNDIVIGDEYLSGYAKLDIYLNGEKIKSGSSGVLVSVYSGKTGWYDNIAKFESDPEKLRLARKVLSEVGFPSDINIECYNSRFKESDGDTLRYKTMMRKHDELPNWGNDYGIIAPGNDLVVVSRILADGRVFFDGSKPTKIRHRAYPINYGNEIRISASDKYLNVVKFD